MEKRGRPKAFKNVKDLKDRMQGFNEYCEENKFERTWERLAAYLHVDRDTLTDYSCRDGIDENGDYDPKQDFTRVLREIKGSLNAEIVDKNLKGDYRDIPTIFNLKNNYNYKDQQEIKTDNTIHVSLGDLDKYSD